LSKDLKIFRHKGVWWVEQLLVGWGRFVSSYSSATTGKINVPKTTSAEPEVGVGTAAGLSSTLFGSFQKFDTLGR